MSQESESILLESNIRTRKRRIYIGLLGLLCAFAIAFVVWLQFNKGWQITLQASGLASTFLGAAFLAIGALPSKKTVIEVSKTKYDFNKDLLDTLLLNRLAAKIGIVFIILGYIFQGVGLLL